MRIVTLTESNHKLLSEDEERKVYFIQFMDNSRYAVLIPMGYPIHHTHYYAIRLDTLETVLVPAAAYRGCSYDKIKTAVLIMLKLHDIDYYEKFLPF